MSTPSAVFSGNIPQSYDKYMGPILFAGFGHDTALMVAEQAPAHILEVAAGTGIVTRQMRDLLPADSSIVATDLSPAMLEIAKAKFSVGENVTFEVADATALPYASQSFDAVVFQYGIMFLPDKEQGMREAFRVLKPAGKLFLVVWDCIDQNPFGLLAHATVCEQLKEDPPQFFKMPFSYCNVQQATIALRNSGFPQVQVIHLERQTEIPSVDLFARGAVLGSPILPQLLERGADPERVIASLAAKLKTAVQATGGRLPMKSIVYVAARG